MEEYQTEELRLDIAGCPIRLLQITNTDELMERLLAKGDDHEDVRDERIPYWADLWPSALALARHLVESKVVRPGMKVTEIGCGLGLPGIVAGALGARVTFSDYLEEALAFARRNWALNNPGAADFVRMDWRHPDPSLAADLVLASDIAYERRFFADLPNAFRTLCRPGGTILVSEPNRAMAREFFASLHQQGFSVTSFSVKGVFNKLPYRVNIHSLTPG